MFEVFQIYVECVRLDVSKIDLDIIHVAMTIHTFSVFYLFQTHVANVSSVYFKSKSGVAHVAMVIHVCV
jgi:hypothetical protein